MDGDRMLQITSIESLKDYSKGALVQLPDFSEGQEFVARLRRPSMLALVKNGSIPNSLLRSANSLFEGGAASVLMTEDDNAMEQLFSIMDKICEASFVEPSYEAIKEAGIELTDEQMMFIFNYSQNGVKSLDSFRQ